MTYYPVFWLLSVPVAVCYTIGQNILILSNRLPYRQYITHILCNQSVRNQFHRADETEMQKKTGCQIFFSLLFIKSIVYSYPLRVSDSPNMYLQKSGMNGFRVFVLGINTWGYNLHWENLSDVNIFF